MKKVKKLIALILIAGSISTMTACNLVNKSPEAKAKTVVATVLGEDINIAQLDAMLKSDIDGLKKEYGEDFENKIDTQLKEQLNQARQSVLNQLVEEKILLAKAKELNLIPSDKELKENVKKQKEDLIGYYGDEKTLKEAMDYFGYTDETFITFLENNAIQEAVINNITKDIKVSDEEAKKYYDENQNLFKKGPGAKAKHILFEDEKLAKEAKSKIDSGKSDFETLFEEYKENKAQMKTPIAEDLGFVQFEEPDFDKEFLKGFKKVEKDKTIGPVKSSFGYHLIMASEITDSEKTTKFEDVKKDIKSQLEYSKKMEVYKNKLIEWEKELNIKVSPEKIK